MSPIQFRKVLRLGPIALNLTKRGLSSISVRFGRWSWNSRTRAQRVNLPGPFAWVSRRRRAR